MEKHRVGRDGRFMDDVSGANLPSGDFEAFEVAKSQVSSMRVPKAFSLDDPHARLFFAAFDGTGNDVFRDAAHATNVAAFFKEISGQPDQRIAAHYLPGPGTQASAVARAVDGATGYSVDQRVEVMYSLLVREVAVWQRQDPDAKIYVISSGFSRGAEEAAMFARAVHDRGIVTIGRGEQLRLAEPGSVAQSVALFDPVGTGHPHRHDRHLPSSVVSALQIVARDERRTQFPASMIVPPGSSADGRMLAVTVPGSHSDVGGSYHADGLAKASGNLMAAFINAHSDTPLVPYQSLPERKEDYVIHHSEEHAFFYTTGRFAREGSRHMVGAQKSAPHCRVIEPCQPPDPADPSMLERLRFQHPSADVPRIPDAVLADHDRPTLREETPLDIRVDRVTPPHDPRHPGHDDHALYRDLHEKLEAVHAQEGIRLAPQQTERLALCSVVEARRAGMCEVTHVSLGQDRHGQVLPEVHLYQAHDGNLDDVRTRWSKVDALQAFEIDPVAAARELEQVQAQAQQVQREQAMQASRNEGMSHSM